MTFLGTDDEVYTEAMFLMCNMEFVKFLEKQLAKNENGWLCEILLPHYERCMKNSLLDENVKTTIRKKWQNATDYLKGLSRDISITEIPEQQRQKKCFTVTDFLYYLAASILLIVIAVLGIVLFFSK